MKKIGRVVEVFIPTEYENDIMNSKKIGYVENSTSTVIKGTSSAGYIYDKINDESLAIVQFAKDKFVVAEVIQTKEYNDELESFLDYILGPTNGVFESEEDRKRFEELNDKCPISPTRNEWPNVKIGTGKREN